MPIKADPGMLHQWGILPYSGWTSTVVGTGITFQNFRDLVTDTGNTLNSSAILSLFMHGLSRGKNTNVINWSKQIEVWFTFKVTGNLNGSIARLYLGKNSPFLVGDLALRGIGVRVNQLGLNANIIGHTHNGAVLATVTLVNVPSDTAVVVRIVSDGAGRVEWFVDGVSRGSSTGGPTGDSLTNDHLLQMEAVNPFARMVLAVQEVRYFAEQ